MKVVKRSEAVVLLRQGKQVEIRTDMGSCQCGNVDGTLISDHDVVMVKTSESDYSWQEFEGKARDCQIPYGFGATCRELALLVETPDAIPEKVLMHSYSQGTYTFVLGA